MEKTNEVPIAEPKILTTPQAAEYLGLTIQTLRNWRNLGKGPKYSKVGGRLVRYRRAALDEFMLKNEKSPIDEAA